MFGLEKWWWSIWSNIKKTELSNLFFHFLELGFTYCNFGKNKWLQCNFKKKSCSGIYNIENQGMEKSFLKFKAPLQVWSFHIFWRNSWIFVWKFFLIAKWLKNWWIEILPLLSQILFLQITNSVRLNIEIAFLGQLESFILE